MGFPPPPKPKLSSDDPQWTIPDTVHGWLALVGSALVGGFVAVYVHRILDNALGGK